MQNNPPNNPEGFTNQEYDQSYIQQQINQQIAGSDGIRINVIEIIQETGRRLSKHFGNVFLGWIIYLFSFTLFWMGLFYLIQLFLGAALSSAFLSVAVSGITFALIIKLIFLFIFVFIVIITSSMIFYFGFLSYISDLIELNSANYSNIFSGFQKVFQIAGFVTLIVIPTIIFAVIVAIPFGFFSGFLNQNSTTLPPATSFNNQSPDFDPIPYNPDDPTQNPYQSNPNYQQSNANAGLNNPFTNVASVIYSIIILVAFLLYISKLILVPNLLIAKDMSLVEAVKESWCKVKGSVFLHIFLTLIFFGVLAYIINLISVMYIVPAMLSQVTRWSLISYTIVNLLLFQGVFVFCIGCVAQIYNTLYPQLFKTQPFALASKYGRKTQRQYSPTNQQQPYSANQQQFQPEPNQPAQTFNPASYQPYEAQTQNIKEPYMPQPIKTSMQKDEKPLTEPAAEATYKHPKKKSEPKNLSEIQQAANKFKAEKEIAKNDEQNNIDTENKDTISTSERKPIQYISQPKEPQKPAPQTSHVTKFVNKQFENDEYPMGKIVPIDAMRMMKDPEVRFIEVQFQDMKHALTILKLIPIFSIDSITNKLSIKEPLSFTFSMPKIPTNPLKLFFGGKEMTEQDLWKSKE
ncbi:MAG: hypothetical protein K8S87_08480, partial [Planctomycetes bacterium]|nr:hypothetical protein [Planctomycetota bacterium]